MPFSFLIPAFFAGLAALTIPILIHLRQRERQKPHRFPSLMFLRRIPIETSKQKRVTDIPLLLLRLLALALLILAFTHPYLAARHDEKAGKGQRTVVIALDRSMSMTAKGLWEKAIDSTRAVLDHLVPGDRVAIIAFDEEATIEQTLTHDFVTARDRLTKIKPGGRATRYVTALRAARELLLGDSVHTGEIILVTDMQRSGNASLAGLMLPQSFELKTVPILHDSIANTAIVDLDVKRLPGEVRGSAILAARVVSRGLKAERKAKFSLTLNGRPSGAKDVVLAKDGVTTVTFDAVTLPLGKVRVVITGDPDALAADDSFRVVLPDEASMSVVVAVDDARRSETLYLERALAIGRDPSMRVDAMSQRALDAATLKKAGAVVLYDETPSAALVKWVRDGGGLILATGPNFGTHGAGDFLPAASREMVQRTADRGASFGNVALEHAIFAPFRAGGNATLSTARFFRYPQLVPAEGAEVLASFDDGNPAVVERKVGAGRILMLAVPLDIADGDFPLHGGAYLPFLRKMALYVAGHAAAPFWRATGDGWAASNTVKEPAIKTPSGDVFRPDGKAGGGALRLETAGFYDVYDGPTTGEPVDVVAANTPAGESDLTPLDKSELLLGVGSDSLGGNSSGPEAPHETEGRQRFWRLLLIAAAVLLLIETLIASRGWRGVADQVNAGQPE